MNFTTLSALDPERTASTELTAQDEQLLATILDQPLPVAPPRRRPYVRRIAVVGLAATVIVGLGLARITVGGHDVGSSPAAAAVLERAADAALAEPALVVGPGQYLKLTRVQESWGFSNDDQGRPEIGSDDLPMAFKSRWTRSIWIPHDTRSDWIFSERTVPLANVSKDSAAYNQPEGPTTYTRPSWSKKSGPGDYLRTYDPAWYASLSRDPARLLTQITKAIGGGDDTSPESQFSEVFSEVLRSGIAPPDIRATLFTALAEQPGMRVVKGVTQLDGRSGVALSFGGKGMQMIFDADTGAFIGERATSPDFPDVPGLGADKATYLTSVHSEVVDSAPRPD